MLFFCLAFFLSFTINLEAQTIYDARVGMSDSLKALEKLEEHVRLFGERIPQEKVFVHMDNTCYFLGDTIWFSAYTRRTNNDQPSKISRVLYTELWNHDGYLVKRKLVEMRDGYGNGFFELPDTLYSGYFELRAYTKWQLNWGQTEHDHAKYSEKWFYNKQMAKEYFRDYEKLYSRVFPVYDKPKDEGEYLRDMTMRPLRRYFKKDEKPQKMILSLFPEGGNVVYDMPCRIAFEAAMEDGEIKNGSLSLLAKEEKTEIKNDKGMDVKEVKTENRGRGSFSFTPKEGITYMAVFTAEDGTTAKQKISNIETKGVSLQVRQDGNDWLIDVNSNLGKPLGLTVMHEGVMQHFEMVADKICHLKNEELPAGIHQVTVFDSDGRVWADRLFFATKPELSKSTLNISGLKDMYNPYEEIVFDVKTEEGSTFADSHLSLTVRDANQQDATFDTGNIMTEMLLASELKGFIPHPEWFFEEDDEEHRRALDLLLMTQGWRRFSWQEMALPGAWSIVHPAEQSPYVTGSVNKYQTDINDEVYSNGTYIERLNAVEFFNSEHFQREKFFGIGKMKKEVRVHVELVKPDAPVGSQSGMIADCTTDNYSFNLNLPNFYGDCVMFVTAKDTTLWDKKLRKMFSRKGSKDAQNAWIQPESGPDSRNRDYAEFYVRLNNNYPRWIKPYTYYQTHLAPLTEKEQKGLLMTDKTHLMDEVTIRGRRNVLRGIDLSKPAYVMDAYEAANEAMDAGLLTDLYALKEHPSVENLIKPRLSALGYGNTGEIALAIIYNLIGDMNMYRQYSTAIFWDNTRIAGDKVTMPPFKLNEEQLEYSRLENIDKVYIYTDYSPRNEGSERYLQSDQPTVEISLHKFPENSRRITYLDRCYILHGFAFQEEFYHPDYRRNPPKDGQKDYRRTLYWNPNLKLDSNGSAHISLYNNSKHTQVVVEANGETKDGLLLYNR